MSPGMVTFLQEVGADKMRSVFQMKCWNCGSGRFIETVSREFCPECKIECNYHGGGANAAYDMASYAKHAVED
jgi:uncharacterized protein (DUF983 family)